MLCSLLYSCHLQEGMTESRSLYLTKSWQETEDCRLEQGAGGQLLESTISEAVDKVRRTEKHPRAHNRVGGGPKGVWPS